MLELVPNDLGSIGWEFSAQFLTNAGARIEVLEIDCQECEEYDGGVAYLDVASEILVRTILWSSLSARRSRSVRKGSCKKGHS